MSFRRGHIALCAAALLAATAVLAPAAAAQGRGYMKITLANGQVVSGEARDPAHAGWIEFTQAVTRASGPMATESQTQGSATRSKPSKTSPALRQSAGKSGSAAPASSILVTKITDKASPLLTQAVANGARFKEVVLDLVRKDPSGQEYVYQRFKLTDVMVSSIRPGTSGDDRPTESLSLNYTKMTMELVAPPSAAAPAKAPKPPQ